MEELANDAGYVILIDADTSKRFFEIPENLGMFAWTHGVTKVRIKNKPTTYKVLNEPSDILNQIRTIKRNNLTASRKSYRSRSGAKKPLSSSSDG